MTRLTLLLFAAPLALLALVPRAHAQAETWTPREPAPAVAYETGWRVRVLSDDYDLTLDGTTCPRPCARTLQPTERHVLRIFEHEGGLAETYAFAALDPMSIRVHREDRVWVQALGGVSLAVGVAGGATAAYFFAENAGRSVSSAEEEIGRGIVGFFLLLPIVAGVALVVLGIVALAQPSERASIDVTHDDRQRRR